MLTFQIPLFIKKVSEVQEHQQQPGQGGGMLCPVTQPMFTLVFARCTEVIRIVLS